VLLVPKSLSIFSDIGAYSWLLLGYAVDTATPIKDRSGINKSDFSAWIDIFKDALSHLIVRVIKGTQQYSIVEDVVVDV
jgi:hypothetical protein